ncbi:MAG: metal ABC transporter substrate-binding protein [Oscillospiraceae bacterium]
MKRFFSAFISAAIMLCCCGCAADKPDTGDKLSVVTTIFPAYDFARQVFGDSAEITLLLKPGVESHSYDPSARDIVKISECDLFIYNGGESDVWVENILDSVEGVPTCRMMDAVEAISEELAEGMQEEHDEHEEHSHDEEYDEHIWTSPRNALLITEHISQTAQQLFADKAQTLAENEAAYTAKLANLDERFSELLAGESRYFVFGDRFPLLYFFKEYGLNYYAAFPGCGSEVEPSAQTVSFLLNKLAGDDVIKTVFYIELSNHKLADTLAGEVSFPTAEFHTCHNLTAEDFAAGETYLSLMERNYNMLLEALN